MSRSMLVLLALVSVAAAVPAPTALPTTIEKALRAVHASGPLRGAVAGLLVQAVGERDASPTSFGFRPYDPAGQPVLIDVNGDRPLVPASNMKVITTAAGLDVLGPNYTFRTTVAAPALRDGVVGTLTLVGGGDPSLSMAGLRDLAEQVFAAGVRRVEGSVVCDGSRYRDPRPDGWTDDDTLWYYGPEVWGIALDRNQIDVNVRPGDAIGQAAEVTISPESGYAQPVNWLKTGARGATAAIRWMRDPSGAVRVAGTVPYRSGTVWSQGMAVANVPLYAATVFTDFLRQAGVEVTGRPAVGVAPGDHAMIATLESRPLSYLIQRLLKRSDNLYAEMLNRELGFHATGVGSVAAGVAVVREFLGRVGVDDSKLVMLDGSGLSRKDRLTARALVGVLVAMAQHEHRQVWWDALPIAGVDGTLASRMKSNSATNNVRAKTGTLSGRTSLSGYVTTKSGDLLVVSSIFNDVDASSADARGKHDEIFTLLSDWRR